MESPKAVTTTPKTPVLLTFSEPPKFTEDYLNEQMENPNFLGIPLGEKSEDEKRLICFKEFLNTQWGLPAVTVLFRSLFAGGYPPIPIPSRWQVPTKINIENLVWEQVQTEKFIDEIWPSVVMMLGDDITNFEWAARVASVLSLFNVIRILPIVLQGEE